MAQVEVLGDRLSVQIEGMDRLWSLKGRLEIPLAHVTGAEADPKAVRDWKGWRGPGTHGPGVVTAGTFYHQGIRVFWDVHDAARAVVIRLTDERYDRLVVGVDDPAQTAAAIRQALGTTGEGSEPAASRKAVVEAYIEGFQRSDHEVILASWPTTSCGCCTVTARCGARRRSIARSRTTPPSAAPRCT
jgi:hypothetical protein